MMEGREERPLVRALDGAFLFLAIVQFLYRVSVSSYSATLSTSVAPASHASNFLAAALILIAATIWLLRRFLSGGLVLRLTGIEAWMGAFLMLSIVAMMSAEYKLVAIEYVVSWGGLAVFFALALSAFGPERARLLLRLMVAFGAVAVAYGLAQHFYLLDQVRGMPEADALRRTEAGRVRLGEGLQIFSTFIYPNAFAGFLVIYLGLAFGLLWDSWRSGRRGADLFSPATMVAGAAACLALTQSKGGWVAAGAAAALFAWLALRRRIVLVAAVVLALAGGALLSQSHSMRVRLDYWKAAASVFASRPLTGVGLLNYQDHFAAHKRDSAEETKMAHNDYLQVLAEMGLLGLLALLGLVWWIGKRVRVPREEASASPPPSARDSPWLLGGAWLAGLGLAFAIDGAFAELALAALLAVGGLMYLLLRSERDVEVAGPGVRMGLAAGLAGLALHMAVDFDLYEHNLVEFALAGVAAAVLLRGTWRELSLGKSFAGVGAAFFVASTAILVLRPYGALSRVEGLQRRARVELREYDRTQSVERLREAIGLLESGLAIHQWDAEVFADLGRLHRRLADQTRPADLAKAGAALRGGGEESAQLRARLELYDSNLRKALWAFQEASRLRPRSEELHGEISFLSLERGDYLGALLQFREDVDGRLRAEVAASYFLARRHAEEAARLYPGRAAVQFHLGVLHGRLGDERSQAEAWRRALASHDRAHADTRLTAEQVDEIRRFLSDRDR
jgi:O-antigen ligase